MADRLMPGGLTGPNAFPGGGRPLLAAKPPQAGRHCRFWTQVGSDLRTEGVVIDCPDRSALDLAGLDLALLSVAATSRRNAAASGKLVLIGDDGVAVYQMSRGRAPALVDCGQATLAVASVAGRRRLAFTLFGPGGRHSHVVQYCEGSYTRQWWQIADMPISLSSWRGLPVAFCSAFNDYAIVAGALPAGMEPAQARRELLAADRLTSKLAVITPGPGAVPHVAVETAAAAHGAIPATCAATLAILARRSDGFAAILSGGIVAHPTKSGHVEIALPAISEGADGRLVIEMPSAHVFLSLLILEA